MSPMDSRQSSRPTVFLVVLALLSPLFVFTAATPAQANSCDPTSGPGTYGGGTGTSSDPYLICHPDHIAHLSATSSSWGAHFAQQADITLTGNHTPIGSGFSSAFTGTYDGGGFTMTGVTINAPTVNGQGLFGFTKGVSGDCVCDN